MDHYGVIMAGGGGTRFWPLSRQKTPKQLLNLSGKDLMINEAVDRIAAVTGPDQIFIVTSAEQAPAMKDAVKGRVLPEHILAEPAARNTAACIGYAAMEIIRQYGDGIMLITPADHSVSDVTALTELFYKAIAAAEKQDKLITIGMKPSFPSTGFGYIRYDASAAGDVKPVTEFREKPDAETAERYVASGQYVWNSGMFIWKAGLILAKIKQYAPDVYDALHAIGDAAGTPEEKELLEAVYPKIRKISIDYAVMEPGAEKGDVLVLPGECGWNDVGSWDMMNILHKPDENENILLGDVTAVEVRDSVIYAGSRTVTAFGVEDLIIVETPDAVMVCPKDKAQDVKKIVDALNEAGRTDLL